MSRHDLRMRVWERGAGETLSSGSGSSATAVAAVVDGRADSPVTVHLDGGDLTIEVSADLDVRLTGPVERILTRRLRPGLRARRAGGGSMRHRRPRQPAAAVPVRRAGAEDRGEACGRRRRDLARHRRPRPADPGGGGGGGPATAGAARHPPVPVQPRPARHSARPWPTSTGAASASTVDPDTEVLPLLGGKEGVAHVCWAMLDPGDVCLAADPGYPVYTSGSLLCGAEPVLMPLTAEHGFQPDLDAITAPQRDRANLLFCNYPNNPTGAVIDDDFFERLARFGLEHRDPDRARQRLLGDHLRRLRGTQLPAGAGRARRRASRCSRCPRPTT